jgi:hypothetical protein
MEAKIEKLQKEVKSRSRNSSAKFSESPSSPATVPAKVGPFSKIESMIDLGQGELQLDTEEYRFELRAESLERLSTMDPTSLSVDFSAEDPSHVERKVDKEVQPSFRANLAVKPESRDGVFEERDKAASVPPPPPKNANSFFNEAPIVPPVERDADPLILPLQPPTSLLPLAPDQRPPDPQTLLPAPLMQQCIPAKLASVQGFFQPPSIERFMAPDVPAVSPAILPELPAPSCWSPSSLAVQPSLQPELPMQQAIHDKLSSMLAVPSQHPPFEQLMELAAKTVLPVILLEPPMMLPFPATPPSEQLVQPAFLLENSTLPPALAEQHCATAAATIFSPTELAVSPLPPACTCQPAIDNAIGIGRVADAARHVIDPAYCNAVNFTHNVNVKRKSPIPSSVSSTGKGSAPVAALITPRPDKGMGKFVTPRVQARPLMDVPHQAPPPVKTSSPPRAPPIHPSLSLGIRAVCSAASRKAETSVTPPPPSLYMPPKPLRRQSVNQAPLRAVSNPQAVPSPGVPSLISTQKHRAVLSRSSAAQSQKGNAAVQDTSREERRPVAPPQSQSAAEVPLRSPVSVPASKVPIVPLVLPVPPSFSGMPPGCPVTMPGMPPAKAKPKPVTPVPPAAAGVPQPVPQPVPLGYEDDFVTGYEILVPPPPASRSLPPPLSVPPIFMACRIVRSCPGVVIGRGIGKERCL